MLKGEFLLIGQPRPTALLLRAATGAFRKSGDLYVESAICPKIVRILNVVKVPGVPGSVNLNRNRKNITGSAQQTVKGMVGLDWLL